MTTLARIVARSALVVACFGVLAGGCAWIIGVDEDPILVGSVQNPSPQPPAAKPVTTEPDAGVAEPDASDDAGLGSETSL